jgi:membrane-associated phospholipid phosphatase
VSPDPAPPRSRRVVAALGAAGAALLVVGLGLLVRLRVIQDEIDTEWMEEIVEHRAPVWDVPSRLFDFVGGGWFAIWLLPLAVAVVFLVARRPWAALTFILTSAVGAGVVQLLKAAFGRARPEEILLQLDSGAYPSGHVANAATVAVLLALLLARWWIAAAGAAYVVLMALSRTYLGAHWVTDTIGGTLVGIAVALGMWAVFAPVIRRERERPSPRGRPADSVAA